MFVLTDKKMESILRTSFLKYKELYYMRKSVPATSHQWMRSSLVRLVNGLNLICESSGIRKV